MATSVPQVHSINDQKALLGRLVERGLEYFHLSGDIGPLEQGVQLARTFYDSEMKIAAHKGLADWDHLDKASKALEKVEAIISRHRR